MSLSHSPLIVRDGLVLCLDAANPRSYPKSGTTWSDLAGANNGTLTNGPTFDADDKGSIVFDGTNEYVGFSASEIQSSSFSVLLWAKRDTITSNYSTLLGLGSTDYRVSLWLYEDGDIAFGHANGIYSRSSSVWNDKSKAHMICITANASSNYNNKLYFDDHSQTFGNSDASGDWSSGAQISNYANGLGIRKPFFGAVAAFLIYNRALTASEVLQNYNATRGRYGI